MATARRFTTIDVFAETPLLGNPVAVIVDGNGLTDAEMQRIAAWTNLSETTFLLPASRAGADYRVRIFTPSDELPFAGHPTLGSAYAWLHAGGQPATDGVVVQQCDAGLVTVRIDGDVLAFAAPPLVRSGAVDDATHAAVCAQLGVDSRHVIDVAWVDNGPGWVAALLDSAARVSMLRPGQGDLFVGAAAWYPERGAGPDGTDLEVRAFFRVGEETREDPVTGSLNASLGQWLLGSDAPPCPFELDGGYVAGQGSALGRSGRVSVTTDGENIWVGGRCHTVVAGMLTA